eukprot:UN26771
MSNPAGIRKSRTVFLEILIPPELTDDAPFLDRETDENIQVTIEIHPDRWTEPIYYWWYKGSGADASLVSEGWNVWNFTIA